MKHFYAKRKLDLHWLQETAGEYRTPSFHWFGGTLTTAGFTVFPGGRNRDIAICLSLARSVYHLVIGIKGGLFT